MIYSTALLGVGVLVGLLAFAWHVLGIGSGRSFGNRVAAHIGIPKNLFHSLLDHGVKGSTRDLLTSVAQSHPDLEAAGVALAPTLSRGVERLEAHFGQQDSVDAIKPAVARLMAAHTAAP